ncbi:hypothetical protein BDP27DRAFT_971971 [Rhodocollybia butyracea]|uniref:Uncharacterized protein n=1 Tax=Rhodocollybia butyracea TaxID=206335 RepID=A0A9P5PPB6_9AGAR|nr:hypothetical protein BDP27DRAFT_971971 [Rhodocollybia butyracea]
MYLLVGPDLPARFLETRTWVIDAMDLGPLTDGKIEENLQGIEGRGFYLGVPLPYDDSDFRSARAQLKFSAGQAIDMGIEPQENVITRGRLDGVR